MSILKEVITKCLPFFSDCPMLTGDPNCKSCTTPALCTECEDQYYLYLTPPNDNIQCYSTCMLSLTLYSWIIIIVNVCVSCILFNLIFIYINTLFDQFM